MGLLTQKPGDFLQEMQDKHLESIQMTPSDLDKLIQERIDARTNKDWSRADEIRDMLLQKGVELKDSPNGTTWKISSSLQS